MFMRKSVELYEGTTEIASGYYVHEVRPRFEKSSSKSMYVNLKMYSIDNLMRINKFSEAYLGRKLREYIVTEGIKDYKLKVNTFDNKVNTYAVELSTEDVLQNLSYGGVEFIQPYLVQYNETFYDFLARVCNRCGEFMYFEDGKLHVGLKMEDITDSKGNTTKSKTPHGIEKEKCKTIDYQNISDGVISVKDYTHDSLKEEDQDPNIAADAENEDLNTAPVKESGAYPDISGLSSTGLPQKVYNSEVANNEFFMPLYRGQFSSGAFFDYAIQNAGDMFKSFVLDDILGESSGIEMGTAILTDAVKYGILYAADFHKFKDNKNGNEIIDTWTSEKDAKMGVPFADNERHRWTTLLYYRDIKYNEENQERQMVSVDMGNAFKDLRIGDLVTLPYDDVNKYVVVEVENDVEKTGSGTDATYNSSMQFKAVPIKGGKFYPPLLKTGAFRQSEPQHAIVIDSNDPKNQGRVRVRFPWQAKVENTYSDNIISSIKDTVKVLKKVYDDLDTVPVLKDNSSDNDKKDRNDEIKKIKDADKLGKESKRIKTNKDQDKYKDGKSELETEKTNIDKIKGKIDNLADDSDQGKIDEILDDINKELGRLQDEIKTDMLLQAGTPWIRMVTPMATKGGGMYFKPEKGDEVMVDFENGNIERPFVVGALYSKNVVAPVIPRNDTAFEEHRIIKSPNGHYIKMEDPTDANKLLGEILPILKFIKQWHIPLKFDVGSGDRVTPEKFLDYIPDNIRKLLGGITIGDGFSMCKIDISGHDRKITIASTLGNVEISALTGITISAPNGNLKIEGKNIDIVAGNRLTLTSGNNISQADNRSNTQKFADALSKTADSLFGSLIDMTTLRCFAEMKFKPVNGTMQIKSHSFLKLEAGEGNAEIPVTAYKERYLEKTNLQIGHNGSGYQALLYVLDAIYSNLKGRARKLVELYDAASQKLADLHCDYEEWQNFGMSRHRIGSGQTSYFKTAGDNGRSPLDMTADEFVQECFTRWNRLTLDTHLKWRHYSKWEDNAVKLEDTYLAVDEFHEYCKETVNIFKHKDFFKDGIKKIGWVHSKFEASSLFNYLDAKFQDVIEEEANAIPASNLTQILKSIKDGNVSDIKYSHFADINRFRVKDKENTCMFDSANDKSIIRRMCLKVLGQSSTSTNNTINSTEYIRNRNISVFFNPEPRSLNRDTILNDASWKSYVDSLIIYQFGTDSGLLSSLGKNVMKNIDEKALTLFPERDVWNSDVKGKILMSEGSGTMSFNHLKTMCHSDKFANATTIKEYGPTRSNESITSDSDRNDAVRNLRKLLTEIGG